MKMNKGVEWAVHACALLAPLGARRGLSLAALADYHGVPLPYMAKQMQLLSKAGIVRTSRGQTGGYALAKSPQEISLWDIKQAVDGSTPAFRCTEIRQKGPCAVPRADCRAPCAIAAAFGRAENAYRDLLQEIRLSDILVNVTGEGNARHMLDMLRWYEANVTVLPDQKSKPPAS
jgi:Rrf2 family protein